jgi:hypothetical protein
MEIRRRCSLVLHFVVVAAARGVGLLTQQSLFVSLFTGPAAVARALRLPSLA